MYELEDLCEDCAFKSKCKKYKENKLLKNKLETAVKALREYADKKNWKDIEIFDLYYFSAQFKPCGYEIAQKALKKIGIEK